MKPAIFFLLCVCIILTACHETLQPTIPSTPERLLPLRGPISTPAPSGTWQTYDLSEILPNAQITSVAADSDNGVWVGTSQGVAYFDGTFWRGFTSQHGLNSDLVISTAVDLEGTAWFGTDEGATWYDHHDWTHFAEEDGLSTGYVQVIQADSSGRVWFGLTGAGSDWAFGNGVASLADAGTATKDDDQWQVFPPTRDRMAGGVVSAILDLGEEGILFSVTPEGTVRLNDNQGSLWQLSSSSPLGQTEEWQKVDVKVLADNTISSLAQDLGGTLWLGTASGLFQVLLKNNPAFTIQEVQHFTIGNGMPSNRVLSLSSDHDGNIWVGTDAGLVVISNGMVERATVFDDLPDNRIRGIAVAPNNEVWIAAPTGVSVLRR